jgi:putative thioredoxin
MAYLDATDATFQTDVLERSMTVPVVVDLWAPRCGPCRTLGPIIERVIDATEGEVALVKVNGDENPGITQAFQQVVGQQGIPLVIAFKDGRPVDAFLGAIPESEVTQFVERLLPTKEESEVASLLAAGDEASLRQVLEAEPGNADAIVALGEILVERGDGEEALALLERIPETEQTRKIAAAARLGTVPDDDHDATLEALLPKVKLDDEARQAYVDILELMGPDDPRTAVYRRKLTAQLF